MAQKVSLSDKERWRMKDLYLAWDNKKPTIKARDMSSHSGLYVRSGDDALVTTHRSTMDIGLINMPDAWQAPVTLEMCREYERDRQRTILAHDMLEDIFDDFLSESGTE